MGNEFLAVRAPRRAAGVCVLALGALAAACSSDPRPPADVAFHSAAISQNTVTLPPESVAEAGVGAEPAIEMAQAYPAPGNPGDTLNEAEAARVFVDPAGPEIQTPAMSQPEAPIEAAYPRVDNPGWFGRRQTQSEAMPASELACRKSLKRLKVAFTEIDPINDSASCRIAHPIKVSAIGSVQIKPAATLNCDMAATFASWTRNELVSSSRWRYMSGISTIHQGSAYSCRRIRGEGKMSAHATGNAIDVMAITLNNGKKIDVRKQGFFAFRARGLLNTVRADGCQYFSTVLGPGYNYDHRNHFHFDLMKRRSGKVACH